MVQESHTLLMKWHSYSAEMNNRIFDTMDRNKDGMVTMDEARSLMTIEDQQKPELPKPTFTDEKYGPHERNVFDFWQASSDES